MVVGSDLAGVVSLDAAALAGVTDVGCAVRVGTDLLRSAGVASAAADAESLVGHVLGGSRGQVQAWAITGRALTPQQAAQIFEVFRRRAAREPLQYIKGVAGFRRIELRVGPGVFVPRPETEVLVDVAMRSLPPGGLVLDLGTGSGAIALSIASERPDCEVVGVESSPTAFAWAEGNRRRLGLEGARFIHGDFGNPRVFATLTRMVDVVVTNPPYVPTGAIPRDPEVRLFDPFQALYSGVDGLDAIRRIAEVARGIVRPGGLLAIEHGELQGATVRDVLASVGWRDAETSPDLTGRDRVTAAVR